MTVKATAAGAVLCVLIVGACTSTDTTPRPDAIGSSPSSHAEATPRAPDTENASPTGVAATREGILAAAGDHDYEALRELLDPKVFLSDFGFGIDPTSRWERMGDAPIEIMAALLRMDHVESRSNEGRLYKWPTYDAENKSLADIRRSDRKLFLSVMSREEYRRLIPNDEYGYVGPRLGILADGTWWFFVMGGGP
jgi:hypothetical protein